MACEYSGRVRDAFRARGHEAMSCDLLPTEKEGPHYEGRVEDVIDDGWDLMIAHHHARIWQLVVVDGLRRRGRSKRRHWIL